MVGNRASNDVSVVIPVRNRRALLIESVRSVLAQTHPPREVIVVDDGSSNQAIAGLRRAIGWRDDLTCVLQPPTGVSAARNVGIRKARSRWLCFLDSDDLWEPTKLERQLAFHEAHPEYRIIHTNERWVRNHREKTQGTKHRKRGGDLYQDCLRLCVISPSSVMLDRCVLEHVGMFDESLPACEDYDLWLRISARYMVGFVDETLVTKRGGHADQLSNRHFGLDRFRIKALVKLLSCNTLSSEQRRQTEQALQEKAAIYRTGLQRRERHTELAELNQLVDRLSAREVAVNA